MGTYISAEIRRRPGRSLGTLLGVALGVALFVALIAAGTGFQEAARLPLSGIGADILLSRPVIETQVATPQTTRGVRQPFGLAPLNLDELDSVGAIPGVSAVSGGLLLWDFGANSYQTLLGVDASTSGVGPAQAGDWIVAGRFFEPDERGVIVVDRHYAAFFGLQPGGSVEIGERVFNVVGVIEVPGGNQAASANFYIPLADAQSLANVPADQINQLYMRVDEATDVEAVVAESERRLGIISAMTAQSIIQVMGGVARISERFAGVTAAAALVGGLILTGLSLGAGVNLRVREIGVMKAIGWQAREVGRMFVLEGILFSFLAALVGIFLGWLAVLALSQIPVDMSQLTASTMPDFGNGPEVNVYTLPARITLSAVWVALLSSSIGGGLASLLTSHRAAQIKPADALRKG